MHFCIYVYIGTYGLFVAHLFARLKHDTKLTKRGQRQAGAPSRLLRSSMGSSMGGFHKWGYPRAGFIMANPMKIDDLRAPLF